MVSYRQKDRIHRFHQLTRALGAASSRFSSRPSYPAPASAATWNGTWGASPQSGSNREFNNQTLRQIVRTSIGGTAVRVQALQRLRHPRAHRRQRPRRAQDQRSSIDAASDRLVTFGGRQSVTIPVGGLAISDAASLPVAASSTWRSVSTCRPRPGRRPTTRRRCRPATSPAATSPGDASIRRPVRRVTTSSCRASASTTPRAPAPSWRSGPRSSTASRRATTPTGAGRTCCPTGSTPRADDRRRQPGHQRQPAAHAATPGRAPSTGSSATSSTRRA